MKPVSETMFHFLDRVNKESPNAQFETFKLIIENGLRFSPIVNEKLEGLINASGICFTDIPLSMCDDHTAVYGKFGIGFTKEFVKNCGGNPSLYFIDWNTVRDPANPSCLRGILSTNLKLVSKLCLSLMKSNGVTLHDKAGTQVSINQEELDQYSRSMLQMLCFFKETGDIGPASDFTMRNDSYYYEREWRIVDYNLLELTKKSKIVADKQYLQFELSDIRILVTPNSEIKEKVLEYINVRLKTSGTTRSFNIPPVVVYDQLKYV